MPVNGKDRCEMGLMFDFTAGGADQPFVYGEDELSKSEQEQLHKLLDKLELEGRKTILRFAGLPTNFQDLNSDELFASRMAFGKLSPQEQANLYRRAFPFWEKQRETLLYSILEQWGWKMTDKELQLYEVRFRSVWNPEENKWNLFRIIVHFDRR